MIKKTVFFLIISLFSAGIFPAGSCSEAAKRCYPASEIILTASTPGDSLIRSMLPIPPDRLADYIRWHLIMHTGPADGATWVLNIRYGEEQPGTPDFTGGGHKLTLRGTYRVAKHQTGNLRSDIYRLQSNEPGDSSDLRKLFTLSDAENILGEKAHLEDSVLTVRGDASIYKCAYIAESKDQKTGETGAVYVMLEDYKEVSSAEEVYTSIKTANENHEGIKVLDNVGDEAYFHGDGQNFYFILVRKGQKIFRMKVNKITSNTSLDNFNRIARNMAVSL